MGELLIIPFVRDGNRLRDDGEHTVRRMSTLFSVVRTSKMFLRRLILRSWTDVHQEKRSKCLAFNGEFLVCRSIDATILLVQHSG
jgi:hypothetical protein